MCKSIISLSKKNKSNVTQSPIQPKKQGNKKSSGSHGEGRWTEFEKEEGGLGNIGGSS